MHEKEIEIRWRDLDPYGHVNHAVFLTYLEEVRDEWLMTAVGDDALGYVVARVEIDYRRELTQKDDRVVAAHQAGLAGDVERPHRRGAPRQGRRARRGGEGRPRRLRRPTSAAPAHGRRAGRARACLTTLLSPLLVGSVRLRNRIVSTAHQTTLVHDHLPTDDFVAYHEARARGGVGLIVLEATAVDPSGLLTPHTLAGYREESTAGFARVAEAVRPHGARLFVQLFHGGREQIASPPRTPAISASAVPSRRFHVEPRAATQADIESIVDGYARSAANVAAAGLDGIEISAAHNYLAAQFFTPGLNRRDDEWAEPGRFLLAVLEAVRRAARGLALGVRLSADSEAARNVVGELATPRRLRQHRARRVLDVPRRHGHRAPAALPGERDRRLRRASASGRRSSARRASSTRSPPTGSSPAARSRRWG